MAKKEDGFPKIAPFGTLATMPKGTPINFNDSVYFAWKHQGVPIQKIITAWLCKRAAPVTVKWDTDRDLKHPHRRRTK